MKMQYSLPVTVFREGDNFVAYTPALDLSTSGNSYEQAAKRFQEVVEVFFEELADKGTTDLVLASLGWQKQEKSWMPPVMIANEPWKVNVSIRA